MTASWLGDVDLKNIPLEMRNYNKSYKNEISPFYVAGGAGGIHNLLHQTDISDTHPPLWIYHVVLPMRAPIARDLWFL